MKSAFGYHIIQTEQKVAAGTEPLADVKDAIVKALLQDKEGAAEGQYAQQLAAEAKKNGLEKTAAAHGMQGGPAGHTVWISKGAGAAAAGLVAVNIFGGFLVTQRMLAMYRKKERGK